MTGSICVHFAMTYDRKTHTNGSAAPGVVTGPSAMSKP